MATLPVFPQSLQGAKRTAQSVTEIVQGMRNQGTQFHSQNAEGLERHQNYLDGMNQDLNSVVSYLSSVNTYLPSIILQPFEVLIPTAVTTTITPPILPGLGQLLSVFLTNDATGGGQIAWGAGIKGVTANDIDPTPLVINSYLFIGRSDGNAWCISKLLGLQP